MTSGLGYCSRDGMRGTGWFSEKISKEECRKLTPLQLIREYRLDGTMIRFALVRVSSRTPYIISDKKKLPN